MKRNRYDGFRMISSGFRLFRDEKIYISEYVAGETSATTNRTKKGNETLAAFFYLFRYFVGTYFVKYTPFSEM